MSNAALAADYLFLAPLIEQRLREEIAEGVPVEGIEQLSQVVDAAELRPFVMYVMWGGDRVPQVEGARSGQGASQVLYQRWIVWLRVRNASTADKAARNLAAGPLLSAIHKAIAGWVPGGAFKPFLRAQGVPPDYKAASGMYPLAFEINLVL